MNTAPKSKVADSTARIVRSAGAVSVAVMCSRVLGLIREQVFAGFFGASHAYDAFVVAFRIPNLLRDLFGEGAMSTAFVTVFSEYDRKRGTEATWQLAANALVFFGMMVSLLTLLGIYWAEPIVNVLAPGFRLIPGQTELTVQMARIMFPFLLFVSLAAVVMGILNTKGKFFLPALSSSFFNLGSIIGGLTLAWIMPHFGYPAIVGMAWGTLIGGGLQLLVQLPMLRRLGFCLSHIRLQLWHPGVKRILLLMLPAVIGLSATQINIFINTSFAASCGEGAVSWLNYAFRLVQLPIGLFGVALSIAIMPVLARQAADKDMPALRQTSISSLTMVFALSLPATAGLIILAEPIIRLVFERGAFTAVDTQQAAQALLFYSFGLFAYSAVKVLVPVFYATGSTKFPVIGSFISVGINVLIIMASIGTLQHRGIALGTSCGLICNFLFLCLILRHKLPGLPWRHLGLGLVKILAGVIIMMIYLRAVSGICASWTDAGLLLQILALFILIGGAVLVYGLVLHVLRLPEYRAVTDKLIQRFGGSDRTHRS